MSLFYKEFYLIHTYRARYMFMFMYIVPVRDYSIGFQFVKLKIWHKRCRLPHCRDNSDEDETKCSLGSFLHIKKVTNSYEGKHCICRDQQLHVLRPLLCVWWPNLASEEAKISFSLSSWDFQRWKYTLFKKCSKPGLVSEKNYFIFST